MKCNRLERLVRNWYVQVQDETLAPARMVTFMEQHLADCQVCHADPAVKQDVTRITALVMPAPKVQGTPNRKDAEEPEETEEGADAYEEEPDEDEDKEDDDDPLAEDDDFEEEEEE